MFVVVVGWILFFCFCVCCFLFVFVFFVCLFVVVFWGDTLPISLYTWLTSVYCHFALRLVNLGHHSNRAHVRTRNFLYRGINVASGVLTRKKSSADQLWAHMHDEQKVKGG